MKDTKKYLKQAGHIISLILASPFAAMVRLSESDKVFSSCSQCLSMIPGCCGAYIRRAFLIMTIDKCSNNCYIGFGTIFSHRETEIGAGVYIGAYCIIGKSKIEQYATIATRVSILSGKHQHSFERTDVPIREQGGIFEKITIAEDSWIGEGAIVMANVGKKSIIGAGSVVIADVDELTVTAGNPAKAIKKRE